MFVLSLGQKHAGQQKFFISILFRNEHKRNPAFPGVNPKAFGIHVIKLVKLILAGNECFKHHSQL